ncbi:MAG: potassium channel family protein [Rubrobacteraceae bacterium]
MIPFVLTLWRFVRAVGRSMKDPDFQALFFLVVLTLLSGTVFYSGVEGWSLLDSFYFSVVTLTTVGYGDLAPSTPLSKVFTIIYLFVGIGLILGFIDAVSKRTMEIRGEKRRRDQEPRREERDQDSET